MPRPRNPAPIVAPEPPEPELVNQPAHYQSDVGMTCLEAVRAALGRDGYIAFLRGTVFTYNWRMLKKGEPRLDAEKAAFYQDELVRVLTEEPEEA